MAKSIKPRAFSYSYLQVKKMPETKEEEEEEEEKEEEEEEEKEKELKTTIMEKLKSIKGIGGVTAEKLFESGFVSEKIIALTPPRQLEEETGIGEKTARKIVERFREKLGVAYTTALDLLKERENIQRITTGSKELDELLGGGIETGSITEFYGEFRTGKTQLSHNVAVTTTLPPERGGVNGRSLFIDTEGTFRPERIVPIARGLDLDPDEVLEKIIVGQVFSSEHQIEIGKKLRRIIPVEGVKVVIVDSLTNRFRSEYIGRGTLAERQQKINVHLHDLYRVAQAYNIAVVGTNQVLSSPDIFFGNPTRPIGGNILAHNVTHRIWMRKSKGDKRVAKVVDSPILPESEAVFRITEEGISDA